MQRHTSAFDYDLRAVDTPAVRARRSPERLRFAIAAGVVAMLILAAGLLASARPPQSAEAATGDSLRQITAAVPACSVGTGVAFDGTSLILSCWGSNRLWRVSPADGSLVDSLTIAGATDLRGLAWDASRGKLWACNGTQQVVLIDTAAQTATPVFMSLGCIDGLAYDGSDDTIWSGYQFASSIQHYRTNGTFIATLPLFGKIGGCGQSGIAVGGDKLFIANDGCSQLYQCAKDLATCSLATAMPRPLEDLECDDVTFAPKSAIWSVKASERVVDAWEVPAGTCAMGGAPPTPTPTNTATSTPTQTDTPTPTPTDTPTPTPTDTPTPTSTDTATQTATPTATDTPTPTNTATPAPTDTPTPVPTAPNTPTVAATAPDPPTASPTTMAKKCFGDAERRALLIGIIRHYGEWVDSSNAQFDLNHDGRINGRDVVALIRIERCSPPSPRGRR